MIALDIGPLHLTSAQLQMLGGYAAPALGFATAAVGYIKRKRLLSWLLPRLTLIAQRDAAEARAASALREARTAEAANANQSVSIDALKTTNDSLSKTLNEFKNKCLPLQQKIDALVDWVRHLLTYISYLEAKLKTNNIPKDQFIPPAPEIVADRFDVPETLRNE